MGEATTFDAIVVGAGIVGAACAKELADAGMRVCICEAGTVASGATGAGMGHIAVMDDSEPQFMLTSYSQSLWQKLSVELPPDAEYARCGSLWIAADEQAFAEVKRKFYFYSQRGIAVQILDAVQLAEAEPNLRPGMAGGLLMPADSVCYPPCVARYLINRTCASHGKLLVGAKVIEIAESGVKCENGMRIAAGATILATGAETTNLIPQMHVSPRKGHLLITDRYPVLYGTNYLSSDIRKAFSRRLPIRSRSFYSHGRRGKSSSVPRVSMVSRTARSKSSFWPQSRIGPYPSCPNLEIYP